jgi:cobalt/nickel transport system permease protein
MRHDFLDRYSRLESPVHRRSATLKLLTALSFIVLTVSLPIREVLPFLILTGFLLLAGALSKIPWRFLIGRLLILEPFALGVAVMTLFQHDGYILFLSILVKSTLCLFAMILMSNTTPFSQVLAALRAVRIPRTLITVLALAYRYLFVLIDEGERIQRARRSRTFSGGRAGRWVTLSSLVGQLFVRSTERAERIYDAMVSRGWR